MGKYDCTLSRHVVDCIARSKQSITSEEDTGGIVLIAVEVVVVVVVDAVVSMKSMTPPKIVTVLLF